VLYAGHVSPRCCILVNINIVLCSLVEAESKFSGIYRLFSNVSWEFDQVSLFSRTDVLCVESAEVQLSLRYSLPAVVCSAATADLVRDHAVDLSVNFEAAKSYIRFSIFIELKASV